MSQNLGDLRKVYLHLILMVLLAGISLLATDAMADDHASHHHQHAPAAKEQNTLSFIENKGQWHENVAYKLPLQGDNTLFLEEVGFTVSLLHPDDLHEVHEHSHFHKASAEPLRLRGHAYKVNFVGGQNSSPKGLEKQVAYHNYFLGNDPKKWAPEVALFDAVSYDDVYPGIDALIYTKDGNFKYDFLVCPKADPNLIEVEYLGAESLALENGDLVIETTVGQMKELKPFAYQWVDGKQIQIPCNYVLKGNRLSFTFPEGYDSTKELVIDPVLMAATLSGTSGNMDYGHSATFDDDGNIYSGNRSFGTGYPVTAGAFQIDFAGTYPDAVDIGISKYNPTGSQLIYATYIGGGAEEYPMSLICDEAFNLYIVGTTRSNNYPVTANAVQGSHQGGYDLVVTKVNSTGTQLLGSTYIGGSNDDGNNVSVEEYVNADEFRSEIILNGSGGCYVASLSASSNFPVTPGAFDTNFNPTGPGAAQDAVVFQLNSDCSQLIWSSYLGENGPDRALGLRKTEDGSLFVVGVAGGSNFPTVSGGYQTGFGGSISDGFAVKFSPGGNTLTASTFYGGNGSDQLFLCDLDEFENLHVIGKSSNPMPVTDSTYVVNPDACAFVAAFDKNLNELVYSTNIGVATVTQDFAPVAFMVDRCNYIYYSAFQVAAGMPTSPDAYYSSFPVGQPTTFYLGVLTPYAMDLEFGTYYGWSEHVDGGTSRFNPEGIVYQAVCSGMNGSPLQTLPNAWSTYQSTNWDGGVFKIDFEVSSLMADMEIDPGLQGCAPFTITGQNYSTGATGYYWDFGDGQNSTEVGPTHTYYEPGDYYVYMVAKNPYSCLLADTVGYWLNVSTEGYATDTAYCAGETLRIEMDLNNATYDWSTGSTDSFIDVSEPGTYYVDIVEDFCDRRDYFYVDEISVETDLGADLQFCTQPDAVLSATTPNASYLWSTGSTEQSIQVDQAGSYWVQVSYGNCIDIDTVLVFDYSLPEISLPEAVICEGNNMVIGNNLPADLTYSWDGNASGPLLIVDEAGDHDLYVTNSHCDTNIPLTVTQIANVYNTVEVPVCSNSYYNFSGVTLYPGDEQDFIFASYTGCDSIVTIRAIEKPIYRDTLVLQACAGFNAEFDNTELVIGSVTDFQYSTSFSCDSSYHVSVQGVDVIYNTVDYPTCDGEVTIFQGEEIPAGSSMQFAYTGESGCDSLVTINAALRSIYEEEVQLYTCPETTTEFDGQQYGPGTDLVVPYLSVAGCDSLIHLLVDAYEEYEAEQSYQACEGSNYQYNDLEIPAGSTQLVSYTSINGCDSLITVSIEALAPSFGTYEIPTCEGSTALFEGEELLIGSSTEFFYTSSVGCDSTLTVNITEVPTVYEQAQIDACEGTEAQFQGQNLAIGSFTDFTFQASSGCDSIVTMEVLEISTVYNEAQLHTCEYTEAIFEGESLAIGSFTDFTLTAESGCDSIVTIEVLPWPVYAYDVDLIACDGTTASFDGADLAIGSTTEFNYQTTNNCDSIVTVSVSGVDNYFQTVELYACPQEYAEFDGQEIQEGTTTDFPYLSISDCDSIVQVTVLPYPVYASDLELEACEGMSAAFDGNLLPIGSSTDFHYPTVNNCDSIVTVHVSSISRSYLELTEEACEEDYFNFENVDIPAGESQDFYYSNSEGCDSIVTIHVDPRPTYYTEIDSIICGTDKLLFLGQSIPADEEHTFYLSTASGCDSTIHVSAIAEFPYVAATKFPSAFSPNGDGMNDVFRATNTQNVLSFEMFVFDRWGKQIFATTDPTMGWDGTFKGEPVELGVYVWFCKANIFACGTDKDVMMKGNITVVR